LFENRVRRGIFGMKRDTCALIGGWVKLHMETLFNLYSSSNVITVMKTKRIRWAGYATYTGRRERRGR
jgi:hypothetical protein